MNKQCVNIHYRNSRQITVMERMNVHHGDLASQISWVVKYSPREREYVCTKCPSVGLCRYVNRYQNLAKTGINI